MYVCSRYVYVWMFLVVKERVKPLRRRVDIPPLPSTACSRSAFLVSAGREAGAGHFTSVKADKVENRESQLTFCWIIDNLWLH